MRKNLFLTLLMTVAVLGGCISDANDDEAPDGPVSALDADGRTVNILEVDGALVHVHAAAGALGSIEVKEGAIHAILPQAFLVYEDERLSEGGGRVHKLDPGTNVTFLVTPFTESFDLHLDEDFSAAEGDTRSVTFDGSNTFTILSPYNESAAFVSGALVYELLEVQRDEFPHRTPGMPNYEKAQRYFAELLRSWGYETVVVDEYGLNDAPQPDGLPRGIKPQSMSNVYAYRPGTGSPDRIVAFGGHYDAIESTKEAAFDDTSGTVMTLALAEAFSRVETDVGLLFGLWGGEEDGLLGSNFFVRSHPDLVAQTIVYINLDVAAMAWPGPFGDPTPMLVATGPDGPAADALTEHAGSLYARYLPELPSDMLLHETVGAGQATGAGVNAQSDHTPFMSAGVPVFFPFTSDVPFVLTFIHGPQDTLYNMTYYMGTGDKFDTQSGEDPEMSEEEAERGRLLNIRSFEAFLTLPFYTTVEIENGRWQTPKEIDPSYLS